MAVHYGTVRSNFKPNVQNIGTVSFKKYISSSARYVGTVRLTLQGTGTEYARF